MTNLALVIAAQGRKKSWLAAQMGVSPIIVSRWVNGHSTPRPHNKIKASKLLGVPTEELFSVPVPEKKESA